MNLQAADNFNHPKSASFISREYFTRFFKFSSDEIEWDSEKDVTQAIFLHQERITGKSRDCNADTISVNIAQLDLGPKLTLRQSAKVMDGIYFLKVNKFLQTDTWSKLPRKLSITAADKERLEKLEGKNKRQTKNETQDIDDESM